MLSATLAATLAFLPAFCGPASAAVAGLKDPLFLDEYGDYRDALNAEPRNEIATRESVEARVLEHLKDSGVPEAFTRAAFADPALRLIPSIAGFFERPAEKLSYSRYKTRLLDRSRIMRGREFLEKHKRLLAKIEKRTGIDATLAVAIVGVETNYGKDRGRFSVFNALYSAALTVPKRSKWAVNELAECVKLAHRQKISPHALKGSYAGAFGRFQFIPSSFNAYAVDFNGDGRVDPESWPDVLGSVTNYLLKNGLKPAETDYSREGSAWKAVYAYNHSQNYVQAVLELRAAIASEHSPSAR